MRLWDSPRLICRVTIRGRDLTTIATIQVQLITHRKGRQERKENQEKF